MNQINFSLFCFAFFLLPVANAQFGEIASIVTGLLGSGAGGAAGLGSLAGSGAGLGSLAGSGASLGSLAGTGAAAGAGAAGQIGTLYQLAQAALQLTGTGVGIVNQASESAWFPAALENAARMNREFQDRLINGQGPPSSGRGKPPSGTIGAGGLPDLFGMHRPHVGSMLPGGSEIGTEFGKNLEEIEETTDSPAKPTLVTAEPIAVPLVGNRGISSLLPNLQTLLPGETPTSGRSDGTIESVPSPSITVQFPEKKIRRRKTSNGI